MSLQGELTITLNTSSGITKCSIRSTRPTQASRLFTGKSIDETLSTLPLLYNICAKAQAISAVRAIESASNREAGALIESQREALLRLESLREHCLRILMDWPGYIGEQADIKAFQHLSTGINTLMASLQPAKMLSPTAEASKRTPFQAQIWQEFATQLAHILFSARCENWLSSMTSPAALHQWASQQQTQAARFIDWLEQQDWKQAGSYPSRPSPLIDDQTLIAHIENEGDSYISQPHWQGSCHELSWFNSLQNEPVVSNLIKQTGNGISTRMQSRLIQIASLLENLESFFTAGTILNTTISEAVGLAHTDAARGRLTHYVKLDGNSIERLYILAPTEWNFHPQGVAVQSLENLDIDNEKDLRRQADLLIHAIDPCVDYRLGISNK